MREINVNITEEFETFDLELEASFEVYSDTYGEDADGNRGEPIICSDLIKGQFHTILESNNTKISDDELEEIEELKESMMKDAVKKAFEKYNQV